MSATVTALASVTPRLDPISVELEFDQIVPALTKQIRDEHFHRKTPIYKIAKAMKVSPGTVSKLMHGETKFPRFATINMALIYFGYRLVAKRS